MVRILLNYIIFLIIATSSLNGQSKTYFSVESGPAWDILRIQDPGNIFDQSLAEGTITGLALKQDIIENLSIGTGIYYHTYKSGINLKAFRGHRPETESFNAVLIPARISFRVQVQDSPFSLTPVLGYQYGIIMGTPLENDLHSGLSDNSGNFQEYYIDDNLPSTGKIQLIEAGLAVDYRFANNMQIGLSFSHFSGLEQIKFSQISYTSDQGNAIDASYNNDAGRMQSLLSIQLPVSNLWQKKIIRDHRRIEYGRIRNGNGTRQQGVFYFGGDLSALWRLFYTNNPAIGPRPVNGRGIFKYANLHAGGYAGIKTGDNIGYDIGLYYQRSSNFISVMYDPDEVASATSRAPFYLEIPFHIRYFYEIINTRFTVVPSMGFGVLTHISGNSYQVPIGSYSISNSGVAVIENYNATGSRSVFGVTAKAGIGFEYELPVRFPLYVTSSVEYSLGYTNLDVINVVTSENETPIENKIIYTGSGLKGSIGVRIPIILDSDRRRCGAQERKRKDLLSQ